MDQARQISKQYMIAHFIFFYILVTVKRRETGQTNALVCTNPQEVDWDEVIPLEVTLAYNKRLKIFEPRSLVITLKCATPKGSKTLGILYILFFYCFTVPSPLSPLQFCCIFIIF